MPDTPDHPVLDYGGHSMQPTWVSLQQFYSDYEAQFCANELAANGIRYQLYNGTMSALKPYGGVVRVDLQVLSDDVERARPILAAHLRPEATDTLEPAEPEDFTKVRTIDDEAGTPIELHAVRAFETVNDLRQAALVLESARVEAFLPRLVQRGQSDQGQGARFILRVRAEDFDRARSLLADEVEDEEDAAEPRCPKCGSWNIHEIKHDLSNLVLSLIGRPKPAECECLKCHHKGLRPEFLGRA